MRESVHEIHMDGYRNFGGTLLDIAAAASHGCEPADSCVTSALCGNTTFSRSSQRVSMTPVLARSLSPLIPYLPSSMGVNALVYTDSRMCTQESHTERVTPREKTPIRPA